MPVAWEEHAAEVKTRMTECPGQLGKVRARRIRDDRLASKAA